MKGLDLATLVKVLSFLASYILNAALSSCKVSSLKRAQHIFTAGREYWLKSQVADVQIIAPRLYPRAHYSPLLFKCRTVRRSEPHIALNTRLWQNPVLSPFPRYQPHCVL